MGYAQCLTDSLSLYPYQVVGGVGRACKGARGEVDFARAARRAGVAEMQADCQGRAADANRCRTGVMLSDGLVSVVARRSRRRMETARHRVLEGSRDAPVVDKAMRSTPE